MEPLGVSTTVLTVLCGPSFYAAMGAHGAALEAALTYSNLVFGGAILIWLFNLLVATVRACPHLRPTRQRQPVRGDRGGLSFVHLLLR